MKPSPGSARTSANNYVSSLVQFLLFFFSFSFIRSSFFLFTHLIPSIKTLISNFYFNPYFKKVFALSFLPLGGDYRIPVGRDPGSVTNSSLIISRQCYKLFISYILRLHVKSFIPARWDPCFVLPESRSKRDEKVN